MSEKELLTSGVSVIILTWNGLELLKECVSQVILRIREWKIPSEIIIIDNGSDDGSIDYIQKQWPDVDLIALDSNKGFSIANNIAVKQAKYDKVLFLNNDIILEENFIEPALKHFEDKNVFAVAPKILRFDKVTIDDGLRYGKYYLGLFDVVLNSNPSDIEYQHYVTFFCGAAVLCDRNCYLLMGGFDEIYTPYAWEDLDLAYNAWKSGKKIIYEPKSICYHKREATTKSLFSNFFFITLIWRNKFIFMWKNITDKEYFYDHLIRLPLKLLKFLLNGRWRYVVGFFRALPYLLIIIRKRKLAKKENHLTDKEVLTISYKKIN